MNRNFIFVFILLAALSLVNAMPHELRKRTTTFGKCTALTHVENCTRAGSEFVSGGVYFIDNHFVDSSFR